MIDDHLCRFTLNTISYMSLFYVCRPAATEPVPGEQTNAEQQQKLADILLELRCPSAPDTPPSDLAHAVALSYLESFIQQLEQWLSFKLDLAPAANSDGAMANGSAKTNYLHCLDVTAPDGVSARLKLNTANLHLYPSLEALQNMTHTLPGWSASATTLQLNLVLCNTTLSYTDTMALEEGSVVAMPESHGDNWQTNLLYSEYSLPCRLDATNSVLTPVAHWQPATALAHEHGNGPVTEDNAVANQDASAQTSTAGAASAADSQQNHATINTRIKLQSSDCVGAFRPIPLSFANSNQSGEVGTFNPDAHLQLDNGINGKGRINRFLQGHALFVDQIEIVIR